jgi:RNA polymerase sigma factor (sigma-70 family)
MSKPEDPLVESYLSIVRRARRLLRSLPDAEDLAADVWLEAFINKVERVPTHMITNRLIDRIRHQQVEKEYAKARIAGGVPTSTSPLEGLSIKELVERLIDTSNLERLSRDLIYMKFYAELPTAMIAQRLGISVDDVVFQLNTALDVLRSTARQMELTNELT